MSSTPEAEPPFLASLDLEGIYNPWAKPSFQMGNMGGGSGASNAGAAPSGMNSPAAGARE